MMGARDRRGKLIVLFSLYTGIIVGAQSSKDLAGGTSGWGSWWSRNDGVMGGVSSGALRQVGADGMFEGNLRLENNGGFSSVGTTFGGMVDVSSYSGIEVSPPPRVPYVRPPSSVGGCIFLFSQDLVFSAHGRWHGGAGAIRATHPRSCALPTNHRLDKSRVWCTVLRPGFANGV